MELFSADLRNVTKEEANLLESQLRFKLPLYITVFCDWFFTLFILNFITTQDLGYIEWLLCIVVGGNFSGVNINISHELMHKNNWLDQTLGMMTLSKNMYMHFYIEHIHGHHKNVATPNDPATSKFNQTVYQFLPQTLIGSFRDAWKIECKRLIELKKYKCVWTVENKMIWFTLNNFMVPLVIYRFWGPLGVVSFLGTVIVGILLLEVINYLEHYGLLRKEISPGVWEKVTIFHSWNTPHRLSFCSNYKDIQIIMKMDISHIKF
jgi:alkane 1-monooxygenase